MNDSTNSNRFAGGLRTFLSFRLSRLQAQLNSQAQHILRTHSDLGQTEWRVLMLVVDRGTSTMATIVRDGRIDKAQISRAVKTLCQKNYLVAETDPNDHRQQLLHTTETGAALHDRLLPIMAKRQEALSADLTAEELQVFHRVIDRLELAAQRRDF